MFQNLVLTKIEKDELQRRMIRSVRLFPSSHPPHCHTKQLSISPGVLENSFDSKEFSLIFKRVDEGVNTCGSLAGYQEKMENQ